MLLNAPVTGLKVPPLFVQVTLGLKLPVPLTVAVHVLNWPAWTDEGLQTTFTDDTVPEGVTVTVVEPLWLTVWVEVATMVTRVLKGTIGAVKTPEEEIVPPPTTLQVNVEL